MRALVTAEPIDPEELSERIAGLVNLRDLGGLCVTGGGRTRFGTLYRSDAPLPGDVDPSLDPGLSPWPPSTVIDLRSPKEQSGDHPLLDLGADVATFSLLEAADPEQMAAAGDSGSLRVGYALMLASGGPMLASIAAILATSTGPALIHCAAGKDRTGVTVAVLLAAVGVERSAIVADYDLTAANSAAIIERMVSSQPPHRRDLVRARLGAIRHTLMGTEKAAIDDTLDTLAARSGGAAEYLLENGLDPADLARLRDRLVDPAA